MKYSIRNLMSSPFIFEYNIKADDSFFRVIVKAFKVMNRSGLQASMSLAVLRAMSDQRLVTVFVQCHDTH